MRGKTGSKKSSVVKAGSDDTRSLFFLACLSRTILLDAARSLASVVVTLWYLLSSPVCSLETT